MQQLANRHKDTHLCFFTPLASNAGGATVFICVKLAAAYGALSLDILAEGRAIHVFSDGPTASAPALSVTNVHNEKPSPAQTAKITCTIVAKPNPNVSAQGLSTQE